ncbi:MAG TPA: Na+/H+ antiporter subunit E [Candidatus Hydrogenedentes bacterium]|nr:Na+/H+ antiporter subunit E [Candidatus Hydrogenedentota bacterium]HQM50923.1 Na+/H+ antiporter subunit E [Candidatus Hydrogenedentota bacterium]
MSKVILFIFAWLVWCLLTWPPSLPVLLAGAGVAALVAFLTGDLFVKRPHILRNPVRYWYFCFIFLPVFLWQCLRANVDVAWRVLNPRLPIRPGIVRVHTELKSDVGLTFLANAITLTPGTMTVDIDRDAGVLYIHCIYVKETEIEAASREISGRFEYILREIFE